MQLEESWIHWFRMDATGHAGTSFPLEDLALIVGQKKLFPHLLKVSVPTLNYLCSLFH